jgi:hypothetical protein
VVDGAGRSCVCIPRNAPTMAEKRAWLRRQVAPVLAMVADSAEDWTSELAGLLRDGRTRYARRPDRLALVEQAQRWAEASD